jgi:5-methyltetrahydrofolate--homocysteine methyltransferase
MNNQGWLRFLDEVGGVLLADGAMGTMLFDAGLESGEAPERWNLEQPDRVRSVHAAYLSAGSQLLLTNTFGANRFRLALHGLENRVAELNRAGAEILLAAVAAAGRPALVAGDIGPSGSLLTPLGDLEFADAVAGFAEQAGALAGAGVDLIWIETMSDLEEMRAALEGVRQVAPEMAVVTTMSFDTHGRTMMGVKPEDAVQSLHSWGATAVGGNCGNGPEEVLQVVAKMRAISPETVLVAKGNAGMPELVHGRACYDATPESMADYLRRAVEAGAAVVGACCGSTPEHLRAMAAALSEILHPRELTPAEGPA